MARADGLDGPSGSRGPTPVRIGPTPVPPHVAGLFAVVSDGLETAHQNTKTTVQELIDQVTPDVLQAESDVHLNIGSMMGTLDNDLNSQEDVSGTTVQKLYDQVLQDTFMAETLLEQAGVHIPNSTDQISLDLSDETGNAVLARLMGFPPASDTPVPTAPPIPGIVPADPGYISIPVQTPEVANVSLPQQPPQILPGSTPANAPTIVGPTGQVPPVPVPAPVPAPATPVSPFAPAASCPAPEVIVEPVVIPAPVVNVTVNAPATPKTTPSNEPQNAPTAPAEVEFVPHADVIPKPPSDTGGGGDFPPAAAPAVEAPPFVAWSFDGVRWDRAEVCPNAQAGLRLYSAQATNRSFEDNKDSNIVSSIWRGGWTGLRAGVDTFFGGASDKEKSSIFESYLRTTGDIMGGYSAAYQTVEAAGKSLVPDLSTTWNIGLILAQAENGQATSKIPVRYLTQGLEYLYQYSAPQYIPDQNEIDQLRRTGQIAVDTWSCLTKAHGNIPEWRDKLLTGTQALVTASEFQQLLNRGAITQEQFDRYTNMLDFGTAEKREWLRQLSVFVPGPSDLVRFMVRDVFDDAIVKQYQLDKDFEVKFYGPGGKANPGPAATWATSQGMTADVFREYWRSHWRLLSDQQLFECLHRLREDRPEVRAWDRRHPQWTPLAPMPPDDPRPPVITVDDVRRAVEVNDLSPTFVDPLIAISYRPMTRTDAIAAFQAFAMSDDDLYDVFRDNGYDEPTARTMVKIQVRLRERRNRNNTGQWTEREIMRAYREGAITALTADQMLQPIIPDDKQRTRMISSADDEVFIERHRARLKRLRRGFFVARYSDKDVQTEMNAMGILPNRQTDLIEMWTEERNGRFREPAAVKVLDWYKHGILSPDQTYFRLKALGYMEDDITHMIMRTGVDIQTAKEQLVQKEEKKKEKLLKDARAAARETAKESLARQKEIDKYLLQLQKERDKIAAKLAAEETKIVKAELKAGVTPTNNPQGLNPPAGVGGAPA